MKCKSQHFCSIWIFSPISMWISRELVDSFESSWTVKDAVKFCLYNDHFFLCPSCSWCARNIFGRRNQHKESWQWQPQSQHLDDQEWIGKSVKKSSHYIKIIQVSRCLTSIMMLTYIKAIVVFFDKVVIMYTITVLFKHLFLNCWVNYCGKCIHQIMYVTLKLFSGLWLKKGLT